MAGSKPIKLGFRSTAIEALRGADLTGKVAVVTGGCGSGGEGGASASWAMHWSSEEASLQPQHQCGTSSPLYAGGNSGLGAETIRALATAGAECVLCCRNEKSGQAVAAELQPTVKVRQGMRTMMPKWQPHACTTYTDFLRQCACCSARPTLPMPMRTDHLCTPTHTALPMAPLAPPVQGEIRHQMDLAGLESHTLSLAPLAPPVQGKISVTRLDLADLVSVQEAGRHLAATLPSLDLLVLNAGVSCPSRWQGWRCVCMVVDLPARAWPLGA